MIFDELSNFLGDNVLNQYNLYKCYVWVFEINQSLWSIGFDNFIFPETEHLEQAFRTKDKLGEEFFGLLQKNLNEPHYNDIELAWFNHCENLKKFGNEVLS